MEQEDLMCGDRIRDLPCWEHVISIEPLAGGITNRNFLVSEPSRKCVVRMLSDGARLGIDRRNERVCQQAGMQAGVSPDLVYADTTFLVTEFITGNTLTTADLQSQIMQQRLADLLTTVHETCPALDQQMLYFCPFQTVRMYLRTARELQAELPVDIDELVGSVQQLADRMQPFQPTLCHNDLLPANLIDDGQRLWLIDWEYAGIGNPLFDLAGVAANFQLTPEQTEDMLACYLGDTLTAAALWDVRALCAASLLREALWAVIQTRSSDLDFDFGQYATEHLDAYRGAVDRLSDGRG